MYDLTRFELGLHLLEDSTKAPVGSAREMTNVLVSDRGGIAKRPGTQLLGTVSASTTGIKGLYTFKKSGETTELPVRAYGTVVEYYHPDLLTWCQLDSGFTSGSEMGFKEFFTTTESDGYLYMCNRTESYRRWNGQTTQTNGALAGAETTITVDSVLGDEVFYSGTASAVTTTTIDVATTPWSTDQYKSLYVKITSGSKDGYIGLISANDTNTITFAEISGLSGTPTFEIRLSKFPATGTLVINTDTVAYTAIPTSTTFTVGSAPAAADNSPVTIYPTQYGAVPRGNRLENYLSSMLVGNIRIDVGPSDARTGIQAGHIYRRSKLEDATDFTYATTRVGGTGDSQSLSYGGGSITDIVMWEKSFAVFKKNYAELGTYTQDSDDFCVREPLLSGYGSINRVIKAKDDVYFVTERNEITSLGRVAQKDSQPQSLNIGLPIKRLIDNYDFSETAGVEFKDRLLINAKEFSSDSANNRMIVFNRKTKSFEGVWNLGAYGYTIYKGNLYYGDSVTPNVYKMFEGTTDQQGANTFAIEASWKSNWINLAPSKQDLQEISGIGVEGYIRTGTTITIQMYSDFSDDQLVSFDFTGTESDYIDESNFGNFLGCDPLGITQESTFSEATEDGMRHFQFVVYFPPVHSNFISLGILNSGKEQSYEITRLSLDIAMDTLKETTRVKTI